MRNKSGWIKYYRSSEDSWAGCPFIWELAWVRLLSWANWEDSERSIIWKGATRRLKQGELLTTRKEITRRTGMSEGSIRRFLDFCEKSTRIRSESGQRGTIITICNYEKWQDVKNNPIRKRSESDHLPINDRSDHKNIRSKEGRNTTTAKSQNWESQVSKDRDFLDAEKLREIWNQHCSPLPPCLGGRVRLAAARWRENPNKKFWIKAAKTLAKSKFVREQRIGNFDLLLKEDTSFRIREGGYDNKRSSEQSRRSEDDFTKVWKGKK